MRREILLAILCQLLIGPAILRADDHPLRRWAVLASAELRQAGLSDLLTLELSKAKNIELVEREQLAAATRELELSAIFGSEAAEGRLKLGRLLKADALLLISREERQIDAGQKRQFLRVVISECRFGARLHAANLAYEGGKAESLARQCAAAAQETVDRFAHGIQQIVGVPPMVSKNLVHDYDRFQGSYARLVETALEGFPGVAVLEIEEARAIGRELAVGGGEIGARLLPVFVEGEFEMTLKTPGTEPTVRLAVRITDGKRSVGAVERSGLAIDAVAEVLTRELPRTVVRLANIQAGVPVSREIQIRALTARAGELAAVGAWEHSVSLRDAVLLLDPKNLDQQVLAMLESEWALRAKLGVNLTDPGYSVYKRGAAAGTPKPPVDRVFEVLWTYPAGQVEYLVRNRLVYRYEAWLLLHVLLDPWRLPQERGLIDAQYRGLVRDYFWRVYPLLAGLDYAPLQGARPAVQRYAAAYRLWQPKVFSPSEQDRQWVNTGCQFILTNGSPGYRWVNVRGANRPKPIYDDGNALQDLYRFLTQVAPETTPPVHYLDECLSLFLQGVFSVAGDATDELGQARFTEDELRMFYGRLKESKAPANVFYGRYGLLALELHLKRGEQLDQRMLDEADQLFAFLAAHGWKGKIDTVGHAFCEYLSREREEIIQGLAARPSTLAKHHLLPENPFPADPSGRVRLEPIAGIAADWRMLRRCSDNMDVICTESGVSVMREKGVVKQIFATPHSDEIRAVAWDGKNFWIGTATEGIALVSPEGQVVDRVGADQGLPPYDSQTGFSTIYHPAAYLQLHAVEPGKCLAIGAFGPHKRLWFAVIQRSHGKGATAARVQVFHKATHVPPTLAGQADDDLEEVFTVAWLKEYAAPGRQTPRLLLVGRQKRGPERASDGRRPLAIDLETLRVSLFPARLPCSMMSWQDGEDMVWSNGRLLRGTIGEVHVFAPDEKGETWSHRKLIDSRTPECVLLPWAGQIYCGGAHWYRIDPQTLEVQQLTRSPIRWWFEGYAVSAHFGMVAWRNGQLFQVRIVAEDQPVFGPDVLYDFVPTDRRQRHARAVEAIQKLGGSVSHITMDGRVTQVYLSKQWKGGDAGLALLQDLHKLRILSLVQAPVTGEGLRYVSALADLQALDLVETKVTDKDLVHIQNMPRLTRLRLEGTAAGNEFSDAGLKALTGAKSLCELTLYGRGFTDQALEPMKGLPNLMELELHDTAISNRLLDEFRRSRPGFTCR